MGKALNPPISQHIFPSTCTIDDELVVVLFEGNVAFDPESRPSNVEEVACDTNGTFGKDQNEGFTVGK